MKRYDRSTPRSGNVSGIGGDSFLRRLFLGEEERVGEGERSRFTFLLHRTFTGRRGNGNASK